MRSSGGPAEESKTLTDPAALETATASPAGAATSLSRLLSRVGPGFVYVLTVLGAGDLVTNSAAGAGYGYALIWTLIVGLVCRLVWVNISAKYVLVTGESLVQGYARVGQWMVWVIFFSLIVLVHGYNMYMILMSGNAWNVLFPLPTEWSSSIWSLFFAMLAFVMAYWGGYGLVEVFCKILVAAMGGALILVAILSRPDPVQIVQGMIIPSFPGNHGAYDIIFILMALVGTMTGSIINFTYCYFIYEKGWRDISYLKQQRFDLLFGILCMFVMGTLLQIAAAATVHPLGLDLHDANDMVRIFSEVQGLIGMVIFSLGLWGAAFSTLLGTTMGCSLILTDISQLLRKGRSLPESRRQDTRRHPVYKTAVIFWSFSPLYVLLTGVSPVWLTLAVSALVAALIPILTPPLMKITSDRKLMGDYANGWLTNTILVFLVLVAIYISYRNIADMLGHRF